MEWGAHRIEGGVLYLRKEESGGYKEKEKEKEKERFVLVVEVGEMAWLKLCLHVSVCERAWGSYCSSWVRDRADLSYWTAVDIGFIVGVSH
jgi:hypothetical protein